MHVTCGREKRPNCNFVEFSEWDTHEMLCRREGGERERDIN